MEELKPEVIEITFEQILQELQRAPLAVLIANTKNPGNIQDRKLRRLWVTAKRAIDSVDQHLRGLVAEKQNAQNR